MAGPDFDTAKQQARRLAERRELFHPDLGHRANILAPAYRLMGIGAVKRNGTWYAAQVFGAR